MRVNNLFRNALIWLLAGVFSFLMVQPSHATVETVSPSTSADWKSSDNVVLHQPTYIAACHARYLSTFSASFTEEPPTYVSATSYRCNFRRNSDGALNPTGTINAFRQIAPICPTATPPYSYNSTTGLCEREQVINCPVAGTNFAQSSGKYVSWPTMSLPLQLCVGGCSITNISQRFHTSVVAGGYSTNFFDAVYNYNGGTCSPDTADVPGGGGTEPPPPSCGPGQSMLEMQGKTHCFDSATGTEQSTTSPAQQTLNDAKAAAKAAADSAAQTKAIDDARSAAQQAGGTASEVQQAATQAAASYAANKNNENAISKFCSDNPDSSLCAPTDFGSVDDVTLTDKPINVAVNPVTVGSAGSCPSPAPFVIAGQTKYFQFGTYCNFASGVKPILLAFAWLAAAGILVGGFKSA